MATGMDMLFPPSTGGDADPGTDSDSALLSALDQIRELCDQIEAEQMKTPKKPGEEADDEAPADTEAE